VTLSNPTDYKPLIYLTANGKQYRASFLNTGVPHLVVPVPRVDDVDIQKDAPPLRFHRALGPKGANVNFVERVDGQTIKVRTFERGVEGETLACGTGVTASALAFALEQKISNPARCLTRSGKTLIVAFQAEPKGASTPATQVTLRGPAEITFKGEIFI
jgi:diaminopimelate epimerase